MAARTSRRLISRAATGVGIGCLTLAALLTTISQGLFDAVDFGDHAAASLEDPAVAAFAADRITRAVLDQSPDLTPVRPFLLATAEGVARSEPFRGLVRASARSAHRTFFAEGTRRVVLSVPDLGVVLRSALERASPEVAARVPEALDGFVASFEEMGLGRSLVARLWRLRSNTWAFVFLLTALGLAGLVVGWRLSLDRYQALVEAGAGMLGAGVALGAGLPIGGMIVTRMVSDPLASGALRGLWHTFMGDLANWGMLFVGLGIVFASAGTSLRESFEPLPWLGQAVRRLLTPPATRGRRIAWALTLLIGGGMVATEPARAASLLGLALGVAVSFLGLRELYRVLMESVDPAPDSAEGPDGRRALLRSAAIVATTAGMVGLWLVLRNPVAIPVPTSVATCNGHASLCDRHLDQVTFAGTHNAMSNTEIPDWLFPHQQAGIRNQLRDGVRALLIDVHYGLPGAARIKTDLTGSRPNAEALEQALGEAAIAAALRIRDTLVGGDDGRRGLYLCHGFCEIGAYELAPTLAEIAGFLLLHPGEVILIVVEDYVAPRDLSEAFEESGLAEWVYRGPSGPPWPTLHELVASGQNVVVFLESGRPGVPWLRPAFEEIQETPYTFRTPEEFSCRPNRGGTSGSLFQINHWIETTPTPLPSNASRVNARDVLLTRARACEAERGTLPNLLAVDFYRSGDLLDVVEELNQTGAGPPGP